MKPSNKKKLELAAEKRTVLGRKVKQLRDSGVMPVVLYGKGQEALSLQVPVKDFDRIFKAAGESTLVYLKVGTVSHPTIIFDVVKDSLNDTYVHADFRSVRLDEKVKAQVQVVFEGESAVVKSGAGIFVRNVNELEVEAFPQDLPHEIVIDMARLKKVGDQMLIKDLDLGAGVKVLGRPEEIIAAIHEPISQEALDAELAEPTTDVSAVEEIKKEKEEGTEEAEESAASEPEKK